MSKLTDSDLETLKDKYLRARTLMSKTDPPAEPYKSLYEARELLYGLEKMLGDGDAIRSASVRALIGKISVNVQEFETAKRYLKTSWKTLKPLKSKPDNIFCSVFTLNQLGLLFSSVERVEKTLKYLNQAEALYEEWKVEGVKFASLGEIFGCDPDDGSAELEEEHTLTLYYMAQAWRLASCPVLATRYCHRTLARQLQIIDSQNKIEWALNAATLSQVFLEHYMFSEACHHLCAASYVLDLRRAELDADHSEREQHEADLEEYNHRKGDIDLCWLKYDIMLLTVSRDRLVQENEDAKNFCQYPDEIVGLMFPNLDLDKYKKGVRVNFVLTYEDARPLFLHGQECANRGKQYYTLNEHASDYIRIQQDLSQLYVGLQFFEDDESRTCKMLKRRADLLSEVIQAVNVVHYLTPCREIWFELGDIYTSMHDTKSKHISLDKTGHTAEKCKKLLIRAIDSYQSFIDSFKDFKTGTFPEFFEEENERSILLAHIYVARLSTKLSATIDDGKIGQLKSLKYYQFVVDYSNKRKEKLGNDAPKILSDCELSLCEEMIKILPLVAEKLGMKHLQ